MKFLVLALCVCAASAASFGGYQPYKKFSSPVVAPVQTAAQAVVSVGAPVFNPVAKAAVQAYQPAQQVVTKAAVQAYEPAQQVVTKAAVQAYQPVQQVVTKNVPYTKEAEAAVVRSDSEINPTGYNYAYETSNGISGQSVGTLKTVGEEQVLVSQGTYRYVAPDGTPVLVTYTADENGYQPQSELLPVAPPVPEAIVRSLAYIAARTAAEPGRVQY